MLSDWHRVDRVLIASAVVLTGVLFTRQLADPVNVIKMTALALCAVALLASTAARAVRHRVVHVPSGPAAISALVLLAAFAVAAVTAPSTTTAVLGAYGRNSGLLTYASVLVLFLVGLRAFDRRTAGTALVALVVAGSFTASYGLLQYAGVDTVPWNNPFNPIIAALGNPNFAAAYLAICTPAMVWVVLRTDLPLPLRGLAGAAAAASVAAAFLSEAAQGPLALAPGLAVLAVAWLVEQRTRVRQVGLGVLLGLGVSGVLGLVAGVLGVGPAAGVFADRGSQARVYYWEAALRMWQERPLLGVGLDTYGGYWRAVRSPEAVRTLVGTDFTDSAHSVPLHLLATGGLLLALAYAVFVGIVATHLVIGLRRTSGADRLLLGALGGSWVAYHVQSFVSIDQVPLTVTQYVLAAGIVAVAGGARLRQVRLPGAPVVRAATPVGKKGRRPQVQPARARPLRAPDYALLSLVGLVAAAAAWAVLIPLRANAAIVEGDVVAATGDGSAALAHYDRATDLVPGQSLYWQKKGMLLQKGERPDLALTAYERAVEANELDLDALRGAARLAEEVGRVDEARALYQRARALDPLGPVTANAVAAFELRQGGTAAALEILESAVQASPKRADLWALLGEARRASGDDAAAAAAYERALEIQPGEPTATAGLIKVRAAA